MNTMVWGAAGVFGRSGRGNLPPIEMPADAVYSDLYTPKLLFFRALLKKK
ncbi:hypothetical protein [Brevibacillus formosus]